MGAHGKRRGGAPSGARDAKDDQEQAKRRHHLAKPQIRTGPHVGGYADRGQRKFNATQYAPITQSS